MARLKALSKKSQKLKKDILKEWESDSAFIAILDTALRYRDLYHEAQAIVDKEGLTVPGVGGVDKAHPLLVTVKTAGASFMAGFKQLKLDIPGEEPQEKRPARRPTGSEALARRQN